MLSLDQLPDVARIEDIRKDGRFLGLSLSDLHHVRGTIDKVTKMLVSQNLIEARNMIIENAWLIPLAYFLPRIKKPLLLSRVFRGAIAYRVGVYLQSFLTESGIIGTETPKKELEDLVSLTIESAREPSCSDLNLRCISGIIVRYDQLCEAYLMGRKHDPSHAVGVAIRGVKTWLQYQLQYQNVQGDFIERCMEGLVMAIGSDLPSFPVGLSVDINPPYAFERAQISKGLVFGYYDSLHEPVLITPDGIHIANVGNMMPKNRFQVEYGARIPDQEYVFLRGN